jgi:hypothetical protein
MAEGAAFPPQHAAPLRRSSCMKQGEELDDISGGKNMVVKYGNRAMASFVTMIEKSLL